jgi:hypothetical protein
LKLFVLIVPGVIICCGYLQILSNDRVSDELEVMWKKACVTYSRYCSGICLEGLAWKPSTNITSDPAEIQTRHHLEESLLHYSSTSRFVKLLSWVTSCTNSRALLLHQPLRCYVSVMSWLCTRSRTLLLHQPICYVTVIR